jgi:cupin 2 domain-containing protein
VRRGRLESAAAAPPEGERVCELLSRFGVVIEQILSGRLAEPASFEEPRDEWVVVLAGRARLLVEGESIELAQGDWLLLPAHCAHSVLATDPGTSWLAVHLPAGG